LHLRNGNLPRGVRKVETQIQPGDLDQLKLTLATHDKPSLILALHHAIVLYRNLREDLFGDSIVLNNLTEEKVMQFFLQITGHVARDKIGIDLQ
jgi:hypothetical protein